MATTVANSAEDVVSKCTAMAADILQLQTKHMWIDYDEEADVLYISFRRPQKATDTIEMAEGILVRKAGQDIVGVTILDARARQQ